MALPCRRNRKLKIFEGYVMRKIIEEQMKLGEVDIRKIAFDPRSRDEIPQLLRGLQRIYCTPALRLAVFNLLETHLKRTGNGRPGMELWKILVLGVVRLNCNWDYDRLKEMADHHSRIREMM